MAGSDVEVIEGRLLEAPTSDATGLDRRAFGEFVGPQGELASYAFGWTTGRGERVGSLSIGIGTSAAGYDGHLSHLTHRIDEDITLLDVLDLAPGERAERSGVGGRWTRSRRA